MKCGMFDEDCWPDGGQANLLIGLPPKIDEDDVSVDPLCLFHAKVMVDTLVGLTMEGLVPQESPGGSDVGLFLPYQTGNHRCRQCGCTDLDCSKCIERTGVPCVWVEEDLCSSCYEANQTQILVVDRS